MASQADAIPTVSVIIPTRGRPQLVLRAVATVVRQTFGEIEVLVVIDGPDPDTAAALAAITDRRLRVLAKTESGGASAARNYGVRHARAAWIAFLDDDDEWTEQKLERQLAAAEACGGAVPRLVTCKCIARSPKHDYQWPRRLPRPSEALGDYLFRRYSLGQGDAGIQTSTILVERSVFDAALMDEALRVHEDWEWMLRAQAKTGMKVIFVDEALSIWRIEERRPRLSDHQDWHFSLQWAEERRRDGLISGRAFASFILTRVVTAMNPWRNPLQYIRLLLRSLVAGPPTLYDIATWCGALLAPEFRRVVRRGIDRLRPQRADKFVAGAAAN